MYVCDCTVMCTFQFPALCFMLDGMPYYMEIQQRLPTRKFEIKIVKYKKKEKKLNKINAVKKKTVIEHIESSVCMCVCVYNRT